MSCEQNPNKVGKKGARTAGLPFTVGKVSFIAGTMADRVGQAVTQAQAAAIWATEATVKPMATVATALGVAGPAQRPAWPKRLGRALTAGLIKTMAGLGWQVAALKTPGLGPAGRAILAAQAGADLAASGLAHWSQTGQVGVAMLEKQGLFSTRQKLVTLWASRLTDRLNRRDVINQQRTLTSSGVLFRVGDKTWHRGECVVQTERGERTISHLQSLALPQTHYYFNRSVPDQQAVDLAAGRRQPETIAGYVGRVTPLESLCPAWAQTKQALIRAYLHGGQPRET